MKKLTLLMVVTCVFMLLSVKTKAQVAHAGVNYCFTISSIYFTEEYFTPDELDMISVRVRITDKYGHVNTYNQRELILRDIDDDLNHTFCINGLYLRAGDRLDVELAIPTVLGGLGSGMLPSSAWNAYSSAIVII